MAGESDIGDWYKNIPFITKQWFTMSVILPMIGWLKIINPMYFLLIWSEVAYKFQIWRLLTALFFFPINPMTGFQYLINLYFLYSYSIRLETGLFDGRPADFIFMLIFCWLTLILLMTPMVLSVLYVWCQVNRDVIVQFFFGTQFKAMYLPWVFAIFNIVIRGSGKDELIGIFVGHVYFFLVFKYPQEYGGRQLIGTPSFLYRYFPSRRGGVSGFGVPPASRRPENEGQGFRGHRWGTGQTLGGN
ncbi:Derlin-1 [Trichoplax sp. H2]|nr:Derlin-1 [Trichoplax sp. H2]|eukprot:RDD43037.1 Derlin-1 [Trichoplax sp. H2]